MHFPASGGAVTLLEAWITCPVAMATCGSLNLFYGTLNAAGGTVVPIATIGTAIGTTSAGLAEEAITLTAVPCVIPADRWLAINASTAFGTGVCYTSVQFAWVSGRQVS
jgi:hypothetical protein